MNCVLLAFLLWLLCWQPIIGDNNDDGRIIDGSVVKKGEYPYMVSLMKHVNSTKGLKWVHFCGGTILNDDTILTASHCFEKKNALNVSVYIGQIDITTANDIGNKKFLYKAKKLITHPKYQASSVRDGFDIGLLKLASKIKFGSIANVQKVCIPSEADIPDPSRCMAIGWGLTMSPEDAVVKLPKLPKLLKTPMRILSSTECLSYKNHNIKSLFCANGSRKGATCKGDSGGPILCYAMDDSKLLQFGIVSFGDTDCLTTPGFYTQVWKFTSWIVKGSQ